MSDETMTSPAARPHFRACFLPFLAGVLLFTVVFVLWWTLDQREQANFHNKLQAEARHKTTLIEADLENRVRSLQRMARRWELRGGTPQEEFSSDAYAIFSDVPGYQALGWVDRQLFIRWLVPREENEKAIGIHLAFEEKRRKALEQARNSRSPKATPPVDLVMGGKGFSVYVPLFVRGEFDGFILGVFRLQEWLDHVIRMSEQHAASDDYRIVITLDNIMVYRQAEWDENPDAQWDALVNSRILDHSLTLRVRPTRNLLRQNQTLLPTLTAVFGSLLSILVVFITMLLQKAAREAWGIYAARTSLEVEIQQHRKTTDELKYALSRLDVATKAGGFGIWTRDVTTGALTWNERMFSLFDLPTDMVPTYDTFRNLIHPEDRPGVEALLNKAVMGLAVFQTEFRIVLSTGEMRYLAAAARVERDSQGTPHRIVAINWDITERKQAEGALKKSEEQVRLLLNSTAEAIYGIDLQGRCTFANPACLRLLGYTQPEQLLGRDMHQLIHHSYPDGRRMPVDVCHIYRAFREGTGVHRDDEVLWKENGRSFPAEYWSHPQIVNGQVSGAVVTFIDITQRKEAEHALAKERRRLADILEGTNVGTWEWNVQTGETIFNDRWAGIIGYTLAELSPMSIETWVKLCHPEDLAFSRELLEKHFRKELPYYECEARMRHKNGDWVWVLDRGKVAAWTDDGKPLMMSGTHQDITERKQADEKIKHLATHDMLTDLPSLKLAMDRLAMAMSLARRQKTSAAVMFIDLDGFKRINDTLGHNAGDFVLKQVAQRLLSCIRETDTVARVGGDEFLVLATGIHLPDNAALIAEKIIRLVSQPMTFGKEPIQVGASIGIALYPDHGEDCDQLIKSADEAMYKIKKSGKNGYVFAEPGLHDYAGFGH